MTEVSPYPAETPNVRRSEEKVDPGWMFEPALGFGLPDVGE
jgi:hypothetical protein